MSNNANKTTGPAQRLYSSPFLEELAAVFFTHPSYRMVEVRFRATDRNLTIWLRPNEVPR